MSDDRTVSTTLMVVRVTNGIVFADIPHDPDVGEGPTAFQQRLTEDQVETMFATLPKNVRNRALSVVIEHSHKVANMQYQAESEAREVEAHHQLATSLEAHIKMAAVQS